MDIENGTLMRTRYFVNEGNVSAAVLRSGSILIRTEFGPELAHAEITRRGRNTLMSGVQSIMT